MRAHFSISSAVVISLALWGFLACSARLTYKPPPYEGCVACEPAPASTEKNCGTARSGSDPSGIPLCSGYEGSISLSGGRRLARVWNYACGGRSLELGSCGVVHFWAFETLRVNRDARIVTLRLDDCSEESHPTCSDAAHQSDLYFHDPELHPDVPDDCVSVEVDGQSGKGGFAVVNMTIEEPASWDEHCPPLPELPVTLSALVNAVDVEYEYENEMIPRHASAAPLPITIRVNPPTVQLAAPDPPRGSGISPERSTRRGAVWVRIWDPWMDESSKWWGTYLHTDRREETFLWDGKLYRHVEGAAIMDEWRYTRGSDLFMESQIAFKDRILSEDGTWSDAPQVGLGGRGTPPAMRIPKTTFAISGLSDSVIPVEEGSTTLLLQPFIQGVQRIPEPRSFAYSFWIESGAEKIEVYESDGETLLDDPKNPLPRWFNVPPLSGNAGHE